MVASRMLVRQPTGSGPRKIDRKISVLLVTAKSFGFM